MKALWKSNITIKLLFINVYLDIDIYNVYIDVYNLDI